MLLQKMRNSVFLKNDCKTCYKILNCRKLSDAGSTNVKAKLTKNKSISDVRTYLQSKKCLMDVSNDVSDRFLRVKKASSAYSFVVDDDIASKIVDKLKSCTGTRSCWIEVNPGLGVITRHLLNISKRPLHLFDSLTSQLTPLKKLIEKNASVKLTTCSFFEIYKTVAQDKLDNGDRLPTLFSNFPIQKWEKDPVIKVFGVLHLFDYVAYLVRSIVFQDSFCKLGRLEHFLLVSDDVYKKVAKGYKSRKISVLLTYFYDIQFLESYPRTSVLPWSKEKDKLNIDDRFMYLMRLTPKPDILKEQSEDELKVLWYFIQSLFRSKSNKIIAFFENWIPNSGLLLIREGFHPMTEVKNLTVQETIFLFKIFIAHPDFDEVSFIHIHESGLQLEMSVQETHHG